MRFAKHALKKLLQAAVGCLALGGTWLATAEPLQFLVLVNTNDPASLVATGMLAGSNLNFTISVPPETTRIRIVCTSDGVTPTGLVAWELVAARTIPDRTNRVPVPPLPGPSVTNLPPIVLTNRPPIVVTNPPPVLPPQAGIVADTNPGVGSTNAVPPPSRTPGAGVPPEPVYLPAVVTWQLELSDDLLPCFLDGLSLLMFIDRLGAVTQTAHIVQLDSDLDGVPDSRDLCPDTLAGSVVNLHGCSIDQLAPCEADWKNHGHFVARFKEVVAHFQRAGLINARTAQALQQAAAQSDCGR